MLSFAEEDYLGTDEQTQVKIRDCQYIPQGKKHVSVWTLAFGVKTDKLDQWFSIFLFLLTAVSGSNSLRTDDFNSWLKKTTR